ncbi:MAG: AAA family ATPase [Proteobacteria bacterium]|nr:AAA family ATPase [Pseudomonadota bacterium]
MSASSEAASLYLAVLPSSNGLIASLTDLNVLARMEGIETSREAMAELERQCRQLREAAGRKHEVADASPLADDQFRDVGRQILRQLLPAGIVRYLHDARPGLLTIQLDASLLWVPWELAWDGERFVGEKFRLCRRIVAAADAVGPGRRRAPQHGALRILTITGGGASAGLDGPSASWLGARLRSMAGLTVSAVHAGNLPRDELLRLIGGNDVIHYIGPVNGRAPSSAVAVWWREAEPLDLGSIAALPSPPLLLISQNDAGPDRTGLDANRGLARSACNLGLNVLCCEPADEGHGRAFMLEFFAALLRGASLAEATRVARGKLISDAGVAALSALRPELYGDAAAVLKERRTPADDNLRQVTIMSIDLVESTRLLAVLGAEKYSELLTQYHQRCTDILRSFGGVPDDFQGDDGAMCYFGMPVAREDAAAQALRAGLQLVDAVQALGLGIRVGVSTGEVVVRDGQPIGSAIHLAARLQAVAAPGTVVVGESTRRIVKDRFDFQALEQLGPLKGFDRQQVCYRLLGPASAAASGTEGPAMTPLIGRLEELQILQEHWQAVQAGSQRLVRILGEAGIGKSRLLREFKQMLLDAGHEVLESRCSQEHANSAFHPLIESLRNELQLGTEEKQEAILQRLNAMASRSNEIDEAGTALLADLLALPVPLRHPVLEQSAERRRQLTVDLLVALAQQRARRAPGCWIIEDVHWLDPSTAEFLDRLAMATRELPLLIVVTVRSDAELRWQPKLAVHEAELRGLSLDQSRAMVVSACGGRRLPAEVIQSIASRADGVPLFIEESARMMVELGADKDEVDASALPVPTTVLDLLTTRLDRLGAARLVAQIGGTIGREFPLQLLQAVMKHPESPIDMRELDRPLAELVRAGMIVPKDGQGLRFGFRHALMRDAAYHSLLERDRRCLHQVIATVISESFPDVCERHPELLASHYTEAGMYADALRHWDAAVRHAASRSAHAEAIAHIASTLAVLARSPTSEERSRAELRLQLLLAARLIATRGYGATRVERAYVRAMELARLLGDEGAVMRVLLGLESYHFMRADFDKARVHALDAAQRAGSANSSIQKIQTQWALANIRMHQGEMAQAVREMDACRAEYMQLEHHPQAVQDPGVMCLCYSAWSLWELGFPDEALSRVMTVTAHAEHIQHKFSMGEAFGFRAAVQHFRGENEPALASANRAVEICEDGGFTVWLAHARVMRGRALAELGETESGVEEMRQGYELWAESGAVVTSPFYLTMRAEGQALCRRPEDGLVLLEQALAIVTRTGERYYEAEIRRLIGQLTLQSAVAGGLDRAAEAQAWYQQALQCARSRELASLYLRAATSLAELWESQGQNKDEAIELIECACRSIQGGKGTRDLINAQARLQSLRRMH